ncbi:MAG: DUF998 domain-containing protein [Chloroflexota bacterium]
MNDYTQIPKMTLLDRILVLSGIAAPVFHLFAVLMSGILHPGYSHISQAVSVLGAQGVQFSAILNYAGLVPAGILTLAFSTAMFRQLKGEPAFFISSCLVALTGIGRLIAGLFPCDPNCVPIVTISGRLHAIAGFMALIAGSLAPLVMAFGLRRQDSQTLFHLSLFLGLLALVTSIVLMSQLWMMYFGGIQRLLLIFTYTWMIAVALSIFTDNN